MDKDLEEIKFDVNEVKKDLYKTKAVAKLDYYDPSTGDLIYNVEVLGKICRFPIHTHENVTLVREYIEQNPEGTGEYEKVRIELSSIKLTDDLKGARFEAEMKGSSLIRWIQQAIKKNEFH